MKYTIVMFSSRSETMKFYNTIKNYPGFYSIINTPHSLSRSCGISVKIPDNQIINCLQIIRNNNFVSFKGIFEIFPNLNISPKKIF